MNQMECATYLLICVSSWPKTNKMACAPSEDSDQPGHLPSLIRVLLSAWRKLGSLATHWAHSEDSDQTGQMPRLIWVFAGCTVILLVLSWGGCFVQYNDKSFISAKSVLNRMKLTVDTIITLIMDKSIFVDFANFSYYKRLKLVSSLKKKSCKLISPGKKIFLCIMAQHALSLTTR